MTRVQGLGDLGCLLVVAFLAWVHTRLRKAWRGHKVTAAYDAQVRGMAARGELDTLTAHQRRLAARRARSAHHGAQRAAGRDRGRRLHAPAPDRNGHSNG